MEARRLEHDTRVFDVLKYCYASIKAVVDANICLAKKIPQFLIHYDKIYCEKLEVCVGNSTTSIPSNEKQRFRRRWRP